MVHASTHALIRRALEGDTEAAAALIDLLEPVVRHRVTRTLAARGSLDLQDARRQVDDQSQEIFTALFARDGRILRTWDPERGSSLKNFVGLVAERMTHDALRKRANRREERLKGSWDHPGPRTNAPDVTVGSQQLLRELLERLRGELSPKGWEVFRLLFIEETSIEDAARALHSTADALYAWRSRLRRRARRLADELQTPADGERPEG